ncbi:NAD kinase [Paenibacillus doosanensis]|uniref:NAD kinase n=1 Tax=Paenibacillus konkukensis TaxID=2020716 RepID=A0ABY4RLK2_9BACL|nr:MULTISPECIES: NAD kinase [Paenibacillus]MCS7463519.1 NAD kinase [Paenibacillus doosanensis]UQZ83397.1 putative inorganic polyphosphate/ATP-NAD kinase [Paenibacillus konkukensis]
MKYSVIHRGDDISFQLMQTFHTLIRERGLHHDEANPDVVLSIGGDGTMLHAFHKYKDQLDTIAFVGIHTGRLGFFADWKPDEVEMLADMMGESAQQNDLRVVKYPLVEIQITTPQGIETQLAFNEFTLKGVDVTLMAELHINDEPFETFRGDGICISTPPGSTAYNKSLGGAIVHPSLDAIQIAEIASINNRVFRTLGSPILLPKHHHCDIYPRAGQNILLSLDHIIMQRDDILSIRSMVAAGKKVKFARFRPFPFWSRVREAFIGYEPIHEKKP